MSVRKLSEYIHTFNTQATVCATSSAWIILDESRLLRTLTIGVFTKPATFINTGVVVVLDIRRSVQTLIPSSRKSSKRQPAYPMSACFDAQYPSPPLKCIFPAIDPMKMIPDGLLLAPFRMNGATNSCFRKQRNDSLSYC